MAVTLTELADDAAQPLVEQNVNHRFVPLRSKDLATALAQDEEACGPHALPLLEFHDALRDVICQETEAFERQLLEDFADYDPDRDTRPLPGETLADAACGQDLQRHLSYLLEKANFEHMQEAELQAVIAQANSLGLRVLLDPSQLRHLSIWIRGQAQVTRNVRSWRHPRRGVPRTFDVFQRLVVIYQMRGDDCIGLKMFKDIPAADVEALLPHAKVGMSLTDQAQLYFGSAGALGSAAWKLSQFLVYGAIHFTAVLTTFSLGMVVLTFKAVTGYRRTQMQRDSQRTRHLYFQNVANNSAVLHALLAMIAEEETKEALLAYAFGRHEPQTAPQLQRQVEQYLAQRFQAAVRFEVDDGLETLQRLSLCTTEDPTHDPVQLLPMAGALEQLRKHWRAQSSRRYHLEMANRSDLPTRTSLTTDLSAVADANTGRGEASQHSA